MAHETPAEHVMRLHHASQPIRQMMTATLERMQVFCAEAQKTVSSEMSTLNHLNYIANGLALFSNDLASMQSIFMEHAVAWPNDMGMPLGPLLNK